MARRIDKEEEYEDEYEYEEEYEGRSWVDALASGSWRRVVVVPLILVLFGFGSWMMWKKYRDEVLGHASYRLDPNNIQYTDPPDWLDRDIRAEVVKLGSLELKRINERGLTVLVAGAFELHPWVKDVDRVVPYYPAKLVVELTYRKPVAVVVRPYQENGVAYLNLYPIDAEAVLLPKDDFSIEMVRDFPRIDVGNTLPAGDAGYGWGDEMVADAARIAELLYDDWKNLKDVIYQIERSSQPTSTSSAADFDIRGRPDLGPTPPGLLVHWGRAPGKEQAGEPDAKTKLAKLKDWVLQSKASGQLPIGELDLRSVRALQASRPRASQR